MAELIEDQERLNRTTAGNWNLYGSHRARVTDLLLADGAAGRICVAGAGNCNDIGLSALSAAYEEVHLVDIDGSALERALTAQRIPPGAAHLHGGVDLTGVWAAGIQARGVVLDDAGISALVTRAEQGANLGFDGEFDVVVSVGVLTQLLSQVVAVVGEDHPRLLDLVVAIRAGHLRTLLRAVRPGGRVILVTEVVSSEVTPAVATSAESELPALLQRSIWNGELLAGVSPAAIVSWLIANRPQGARLARPGIVGPWRWHQSPARSFLVVAILIRKP